MTHPKQDPQVAGDDFFKKAGTGSRGIFGEIFGFLLQNKKWWLLPIILFLLLAGTLIVLGGTSIAPLIYTIF